MTFCVSVHVSMLQRIVCWPLGQARRRIHTRISEHMGVSPLTGKEHSTMSGILAHKHMHKDPVSASDFKILYHLRPRHS